MGKPYSMDLRERVVAAVEKGGLSRHQAAARFGVGDQHGDRLGAAVPRDGQRGAGQDGRLPAEDESGRAPRLAAGRGSRRRTSPCAAWWPSWPSAGSRSITGRCGSFVHAEKLSFKKKRGRQRARPSRRRAPACAVDEVSGPDRSCPPGLHRRDLDQDQHGAAARLGAARRTG